MGEVQESRKATISTMISIVLNTIDTALEDPILKSSQTVIDAENLLKIFSWRRRYDMMIMTFFNFQMQEESNNSLIKNLKIFTI